MNGARAEPASPVLVALPPNRDSRSIAAEGRSPLPGTLVRQPAIVGTDQRLVRRSAYSDLVPGLSSSRATPGGGSWSMPSARPPTALSPGVPSRPAPFHRQTLLGAGSRRRPMSCFRQNATVNGRRGSSKGLKRHSSEIRISIAKLTTTRRRGLATRGGVSKSTERSIRFG